MAFDEEYSLTLMDVFKLGEKKMMFPDLVGDILMNVKEEIKLQVIQVRHFLIIDLHTKSGKIRYHLSQVFSYHSKWGKNVFSCLLIFKGCWRLLIYKNQLQKI